MFQSELENILIVDLIDTSKLNEVVTNPVGLQNRA